MSCEEFTNAFGESAKIPDESKDLFWKPRHLVLVYEFIHGEIMTYINCIRLQRKFCMYVGIRKWHCQPC